MKPIRLANLAVIATIGAVLGVPAFAQAQDPSGYQLIVNASNSATELDRKFVADAYLKKLTHWPDSGVIHPVDLTPDSTARRRFSEDVLDRSVMGIKGYWQRLIFSGTDVPPPELGTDEDVIQYVSKNPGAIGYISGSADAGASKIRGVTLR